MKTALRVLPVAAFRCEPLARTMTRDECADTAHRAHAAPGPKVSRPCTTCPIGEAHLRGEALAGVHTLPEPAKRSNAPTLVLLAGEWVSLSEAERRTGLDRASIRYRVRNGIPLEAPRREQKRAAPRVVTGRPSPAELIAQLRAAGYSAEPDGHGRLLVAWPGEETR